MGDHQTKIISNGGGSAEPIEALFATLATEALDPRFERYGNFIREYVDNAGPFRGAVQFWGNFYNRSHVFQVYTSDPELIARLTVAIRANQATAAYAQARTDLGEWERVRDLDERHKLAQTPAAYFHDIPTDVASRAHAGTSFTPEKRGDQECTSYANGLASDYQELAKYATTPEKIETLLTEFARYRSGYRARYLARLQAKSRVMSTMITGGSNFPTRRNAKRGASADKRSEECDDFRERALDAIRKTLRPELRPIMAGDDDAPDRLAAKLAKLELFQSRGKLVNAAIRKHAKAGPEAQVAALVALGLKESTARASLQKDAMGNIGVPAYELTNNAANIRRIKQRIASVSAAKAAPMDQVKGEHATMEDCPADNRVRLFYPGKPDAETRERLKSGGFRWAPSLGCWQAYRSDRTIDHARREIGTLLTTGSDGYEPEPGESGTPPCVQSMGCACALHARGGCAETPCDATEAPVCDGCDDTRATSRYVVTHHEGNTSHVSYCDDCAALARADWNGETASIKLETTPPMTPEVAWNKLKDLP